MSPTLSHVAEFGDTLTEARKVCVSNLSKEAVGDAILEPALRTADGEIAFDPHGLKTPMRKDLARRQVNSFLTLNVDSPSVSLSPPLSFAWRQRLNVCVNSVTWDYVTFLLSPSIRVDWTSVRDWFLDWFDLKDTNEKTPEGLYGVTHFMSDPKTNEGTIELTIDFGSAPVRAFEQLLDCLCDAGFTHCAIQ